jgi:pimeloyl-ACP methyl ester carboxylesterase
MVHVGCPALAPGTSAPPPMRMLGVRGLGRVMMALQPASPRQVERLSKMVHQHPMPPETAALILATERTPGFERTFRSNLHALVGLRGARPGLALSDAQLSSVSQPSLLVFGRSDPMGSEAAGRRMERALPHAELRVAEGGHAPWLNEPERIAGWIGRFLARHHPDRAGATTERGARISRPPRPRSGSLRRGPGT